VRPTVLELLVCPTCHGALACEARERDGDEVLEGQLRCTACGARFPIRGGIPRLLPPDLSPPERATSRAFEIQWRMLHALSDVHRDEFRSYLTPLAPEDLRGLRVLDAGCGMGKFSLATAEADAAAVVGVDLSGAVEVAHAHLRARPNAHVVQASIYALPFRPGTFDLVFSIGVLHHLPDPRRGFESIVPLANEGGHVLAWLYALEGNERFVRFLDPLRVRLFSRLPSWMNRVVATLLAVPLWILIHVLYLPLARTTVGRRLPYAEYFLYFRRLGFRTFWGTVYDKLVPPVAFYIARDTVEDWLAGTGLVEVALRHRNGNSWTCLARRPVRHASAAP
jgi:SAM-dependent methyltransferase